MTVYNKSQRGVPDDAVYIGRPSLWGNPFRITQASPRAKVIQRYEAWLRSQPELVKKARQELKDRDLVCWCAPLACHGHILEKVANEPDEPGLFDLGGLTFS